MVNVMICRNIDDGKIPRCVRCVSNSSQHLNQAILGNLDSEKTHHSMLTQHIQPFPMVLGRYLMAVMYLNPIPCEFPFSILHICKEDINQSLSLICLDMSLCHSCCD